MTRVELAPIAFRRILRRSLLVPTVLLGVLALVFLGMILYLMSAAQWLDHSHQVIARSNGLLKLLVDGETGMRGFLITNEPTFLEPYQVEENHVGPAFEELKHLVADNSTQVERLIALSEAHADWQHYALRMITLRRENGDFLTPVRNREGKVRMDAMREQVAAFNRVEEGLQEKRTKTVRRATWVVIGTSLSLTLLLGCFMGFWVRRQLSRVSESYQNSLVATEAKAVSLNFARNRFRLLHDIDRDILANLSAPDLIRRTLTSMEIIVPSGSAFIYFFDSGIQSERISRDAHPCEELDVAMANGGPSESSEWECSRTIPDLAESRNRSAMLDAILRAGQRSCLMVPLRAEGKLLGGLLLADPVPLAFNDEHFEVAVEVSRQMSIAIQQERLRKQVNQNFIELEQRVADRTSELEGVTTALRSEIVERSLAQEAALVARTQLLDAIDILDAGLVMYGPDERMVICNAKFKDFYPQIKELMVPGASLESLTRAYFQTGAASHTGLSEEEWVTARLQIHHNRGQPSEAWLSNRWIRSSDCLTSNGGVISLRTDITALKQAQHAAEAANRAKSEFLATMSHEIRTPMNGILGMTELTLDSKLTHEQRQNLGMVKSSADSLLQVINDILDFSKVEAGMLELDPTPFALRDSLGATIKALGSRANAKGLELICRIGTDVPDDVVGDSLRLRQIITNLVGNAIKFTERGEVALRVEAESELADSVSLHFTVRDTGIGIPAAKQGMIFEAFTQVDAAITRKFGGTGLGLAITSRLVALMGGRVWVESELGLGSTFHFIVQFPKHSEVVQTIRKCLAELKGMPVLIVDDNATNRAMLEELLANWQMRPESANDGFAAIAALKRALVTDVPFPLVLLDVCMPVLHGFDVAEQIKRDRELGGTRVVMLTSAERKGNASRSRTLGISSYLRKPIMQTELFDAICEALGSATPAAMGSNSKPDIVLGQRTLRILLAEDNEVNQELTTQLLKKHGHTIVLAGNGAEALVTLEHEVVDMVLMDVQMPIMDGFAATAAIREREKTRGGHLPIVALTAHAMKGDRERCLAGGMDAYVSKPLQVRELFDAIALALLSTDVGPSLGTANGTSVGTASSTEAAFDLVEALERVDGDREIFGQMIQLFSAQVSELLPEIQSAIDSADGKALESSSHKLKGSLGCFAATSALEAAQRLEFMGKNGEFALAGEAREDLEHKVDRLREALMVFAQKDVVASVAH